MGWYGNSMGNLPFSGVPLLGSPWNHLMIRTVSFLSLDDHFPYTMTRKWQTRSECPPKKGPFPKGNESCEPTRIFSKKYWCVLGVGAFLFVWILFEVSLAFPADIGIACCWWGCSPQLRNSKLLLKLSWLKTEILQKFFFGLGVWKNPPEIQAKTIEKEGNFTIRWLFLSSRES